MNEEDPLLNLGKIAGGKSGKKGPANGDKPVNGLLQDMKSGERVRNIAEKVAKEKKDMYTISDAMDQVGRLSNISLTAKKSGSSIIRKIVRKAMDEVLDGHLLGDEMLPRQGTENALKPMFEQLDRQREKQCEKSAKNERLDKDLDDAMKKVWPTWRQDLGDKQLVNVEIRGLFAKVWPLIKYLSNDQYVSLSVHSASIIGEIRQYDEEFAGTKMSDILKKISILSEKLKEAEKPEGKAIKEKIQKLLDKLIGEIHSIKTADMKLHPVDKEWKNAPIVKGLDKGADKKDSGKVSKEEVNLPGLPFIEEKKENNNA